MKIVCLGDSLTFGYGVNTAQNWCQLLQKKTGINFINKGLNGDTTGGMHARFAKDVVQEEPDALCLIGGTNDIFLNEVMSNIHCNIAAMIQWALREGIKPFLATPIAVHAPLKDNEWTTAFDFSKVNQRLIEYREWLLQYAKVTQIMLVDLHQLYEEEMKRHEQEMEHPYIYEEFYVDGVHPSEKGHEIISRIIYDEMIKRKGITG